MKIVDKIYGEFEITEPVLLALLKSPSILRLKKISQSGLPSKFHPYPSVSRYDHSVGVMLLLRRLGADLEEQVAGLLHDVSHLAFSHTADWLFHDGNEDAHDLSHHDFIEETEIPAILKQSGLSVVRLLNEKNYPLLDQEIPDLCADRIVYVLREPLYSQKLKLAKLTFESLSVYRNRIVFTDSVVARDFAINFLEFQTNRWGGYEDNIKMILFVDTLKLALEKGIITKDDFWLDDEIILSKLEKSDCQQIATSLSQLSSSAFTDFYKPKGQKIWKKFRYVDPAILIDGKVERLSKISPDFKKILSVHRKINRQGIMI